jgi:hypothetical protein
MRGFVDEVDVVQHENFDLVVDEAFNASAKVFRVNPGMTYTSVGPVFYQNDLSANFPEGGGLLWIDGELLAYQSRKDGSSRSRPMAAACSAPKRATTTAAPVCTS